MFLSKPPYITTPRHKFFFRFLTFFFFGETTLTFLRSLFFEAHQLNLLRGIFYFLKKRRKKFAERYFCSVNHINLEAKIHFFTFEIMVVMYGGFINPWAPGTDCDTTQRVETAQIRHMPPKIEKLPLKTENEEKCMKQFLCIFF